MAIDRRLVVAGTTLAVVAVGLIVYLTLGRHGTAATAAPPVSQHSAVMPTGCVSLTSMGVSAQGFDSTVTISGPTTVAHPVEVGHAQFRLPSGASQGPSTWYIVHVHLGVTVDGTSGEAGVAAYTDDASAADILLQVGPTGIDWSTHGLSEPDQQSHSSDGRVEAVFSNYLRAQGVAGGLNTLSFKAEASGGARITAVHVFSDTCIETTDRAPAQQPVPTVSMAY